MTSKKSVFSYSQVNSVFVVLVVKTITVTLPGGGPKSAHGSYFQYVDVPGINEYNFGFHRGNSDHFISRFDQGKDWKFKSKVNWFDKHGGSGEHYWEYNHIDKTGGHGKGGQDIGSGEIGNVLAAYGSPPITYHSHLPAYNHGESYEGSVLVDHDRSTPQFEGLSAKDGDTANKGYIGNDNSFGILVESIKTSLEKPLEEYLNEEVIYKVVDHKDNKGTGETIELPSLDAKPEASLYTNVSQKASDNGNRTDIPDHVPESTNAKIYKSKNVNETNPVDDYDVDEEGDYDYYGDEDLPDDDYYQEDDDDVEDDDFVNQKEEDDDHMIRKNQT
ncbi:hypothetical protein C0J52_27498 [Blattella germanica]|nr:hypothetical protein C0J52_27498 [Blattella germanica]